MLCVPSTIRRDDRDPQELKRVFEKGIAYEIWMMQATARELAQASFPADAAFRNAFLESFLLHVRNLLEFLAPGGRARRDQDTVIACDYFPEPEIWEGDANQGEMGLRGDFERHFEKQLAQAPELGCCSIEGFRRLLNKKLAHVAFSNRELTHWPLGKIMEGVQGGFRLFAKAIQDKGKQEIRSLGLDVTAQDGGT